MTTDAPTPLSAGFLRSCARFADRDALRIGGRGISYQALRDTAASLAATLQHVPGTGPEPGWVPTRGVLAPEALPLTGVLARRSEMAYAGVLAALLRGHGYVPLNPTFPAARLRDQIAASKLRALIVDEAGASALPAIVDDLPPGLVLLVADDETAATGAARAPQHRWIGPRDRLARGRLTEVTVHPDAAAYVLFTSGSTGRPKGVLVTHANVQHFLDVVVARYRLTEQDRLSQLFELVFDLSVFDLFAAWEVGACVCIASAADLMMPARYALDEALTVWFSVPSVASHMQRLRMLEKGLYPALRWVLFCGEGLPDSVARAFASAAPHATVENLYGPTEATLACTVHRWQADAPVSAGGLVPIGRPLSGLTAEVSDEGELRISGPQVAAGYLDDPERTGSAFVGSRNGVAYRTGDRVHVDADGCLHFLGRLDHQVKIQGHRVELGEVEAAIRAVGRVATAVAVPFPAGAVTADGLVAFVDQPVDAKEVIQGLRERLPTYMVPREVRAVEIFPLNDNGKIDRRALQEQVGRGA